MKMLWKLTKEAARYKGLYVIAILSTLSLTAINLAAPKVLSTMTGVVEKGVDEATASVDVQTEKQIQKAIKNIAGKRTIVAIAHRLSTIKEADMILVIHEGKIAEQGSHEELLQKKGIYYKMMLAQE